MWRTRVRAYAPTRAACGRMWPYVSATGSPTTRLGYPFRPLRARQADLRSWRAARHSTPLKMPVQMNGKEQARIARRISVVT